MEFAHRDDALAAWPADDRLRAQDVADGGQVLGRIGLAEGASDGSSVANDGISDHPLGVGDYREEPGYLVGFQERRMAGHRADTQLIPVAENEVEFEQVVDVDEPFGPGKPELHHRQQAVPASDDP